MKFRNVLPVVLAIVSLSTAPALLVAQDTPAYLETRDVPHGNVESVAYASSALGTNREVVVYTPPGYEDGSERYPVLYLLHGAGGNQTNWTERGMAHVILDNMIADGRIDPMVVVMPFGFAFQREPGAVRDADENKRQREGFARDFLEDVIPLIDGRYRVETDREHRAIAGLSLGGAQALAIGLTHTDLFSRVAAFSPAMGAANNPETGGVDFDLVLDDAAHINGVLDLLWIGCGFDDTLFDSNVAFSNQLNAHGVEHAFRVTEGAHTYEVWQRYFYEVGPQIF